MTHLSMQQNHHHHRSKPKVPSPLGGAHVNSLPQLAILSDVAAAVAKLDGDSGSRKRKRDVSFVDEIDQTDFDARIRDDDVRDLRNRLLKTETCLTQTQERLEEIEASLIETMREKDDMTDRLKRAENVQAKAIKHASDAALYSIISRVCAGDERTATIMTTDLILKMNVFFASGSQALMKELDRRRQSKPSTTFAVTSTPIVRLLSECTEEDTSMAPTEGAVNPKMKDLVSKLRQRMATEPSRPITKWGAFKAAGTIPNK